MVRNNFPSFIAIVFGILRNQFFNRLFNCVVVTASGMLLNFINESG